MTVGELRAKYAQVFGEETRAGNRVWLVKRIVWRLQALAEDDLSERAQLATQDTRTGDTLAFYANGLPPGLVLGSGGGISGTIQSTADTGSPTARIMARRTIHFEHTAVLKPLLEHRPRIRRVQ